MVNICVPVLRRYDLLEGLLTSLRRSSVQPDRIVVIDNGRDAQRLEQALKVAARGWQLSAHVPETPMGVAESWNWFIKNVKEDRVICNDDLVFQRYSLQRLLNSPADLVWAEGCGFSCFVLRDSCVEKIGMFDETISPGYGYYEDDDYLQRLDGRGTRAPSAVAESVEADVMHLHSQTLEVATPDELVEHHRKFKIAQSNYARKWGVKF